MKRYLVILSMLFVAACGAAPTSTPDLVATQIAVEEAAHATMTARAPTATNTANPTATHTPTVTIVSTATPTPMPEPSLTPAAQPNLDAEVSLESCRLTLDDLPVGYSVTMSKTLDLLDSWKPEDLQFTEELTGKPELGLITIDKIVFTDGQTNIVQTMGTFQGPVQAHSAAVDAQGWWSLYGMFEPFELSTGSPGDETFAYYHRLVSGDGGWICRVCVRYGAGISMLALGLPKSEQGIDQVLQVCEGIVQKMDQRVEHCTSGQ